MAQSVCDVVCIRMTDVLARVLCILLVICQGAMLDFYLIFYNNMKWYAWVVADVFALSAIGLSLVTSYMHIRHKRATPSASMELPIVFVCWLVYSAALVARVAVIFRYVAPQLMDSERYGPNVLRTILAVTAIIFLLYVVCHHDAKPNSARQAYISYMIGGVTMDIFDSVTLLDVLFTLESHVLLPFSVTRAVAAFGCINFLLPAVTLLGLSGSHFGRKVAPARARTAHTLAYLLLVDVPYAVLRVWLWHVYYSDVSVFLIKNLVMIYVALRSVWEQSLDGADDADGGGGDESEMNMMQPPPVATRPPRRGLVAINGHQRV